MLGDALYLAVDRTLTINFVELHLCYYWRLSLQVKMDQGMLGMYKKGYLWLALSQLLVSWNLIRPTPASFILLNGWQLSYQNLVCV